VSGSFALSLELDQCFNEENLQPQVGFQASNYGLSNYWSAVIIS